MVSEENKYFWNFVMFWLFIVDVVNVNVCKVGRRYDNGSRLDGECGELGG